MVDSVRTEFAFRAYLGAFFPMNMCETWMISEAELPQAFTQVALYHHVFV